MSRGVRILAVLTMLASLGSCQLAGLFTLSAFPADLSRLSARTDLSAEISADVAGSFTLSAALMNDGTELVILASAGSFTGVHLYILDGSLNLTQTLTDTDLYSGGPFAGTTAFADAESPQRIAVGNRVFSVSGTHLTGLTALPTTLGWGFPAGAPVNMHVADIGVGGDFMSINQYTRDWVFSNPRPNMSISSGVSSFSLHRLFTDPARTSTLMVLFDQGANMDRYLEVPWTDFTDIFGLMTPILPKYLIFSKVPARENLIGFAKGVFIGFRQTGSDSRTGEIYCYDLTGKELPGTLGFERSMNADSQLAVAPSGEHFFIYDPQTRVVSRLNGWWPK